MNKFYFVLSTIFITSCSSQPIVPDANKVKVSRESPSSDCRDLGVVYGRTLKTIGNLEEEALSDLKENASKKGANFLYLQEYGALGSSVKGIAYSCP